MKTFPDQPGFTTDLLRITPDVPRFVPEASRMRYGLSRMCPGLGHCCMNAPDRAGSPRMLVAPLASGRKPPDDPGPSRMVPDRPGCSRMLPDMLRITPILPRFYPRITPDDIRGTSWVIRLSM